MHDIAPRARVDPALLHHYFGTKQQLFVAASEFPVDPAEIVPRMIAGPPELMGERVVLAVVGLWDRPELRPLLLGIIRSATTDPVAAGMARRLLAEGPFLELARALDVPDAEVRATLAGTQLIGLAIARYVIGLEPVASMTPDQLAQAIGPTLGRYLSGEVRLTSEGGPG
jgi:AcrR family transcriptional regulator